MRRVLEEVPAIGVLYYTLNDRRVLADSDNWLGGRLGGVEELGADVSGAAMAQLRTRLAAVRKGVVALNEEGDAKHYEDLGVGFYVLDNHPLVSRFLKPPKEDA